MHADATPMLITPFLSEESRAICVDHDVGYLDLHGNAFFHVPGVLIDIGVPGRPAAEQRDLKSLFRPKAAHILRIMLRDPKRAWRVSDLAAASEASLGHVSNVRRALLSREWAREEAGGVALTDPDALLDAWRDVLRASTVASRSPIVILRDRRHHADAADANQLVFTEMVRDPDYALTHAAMGDALFRLERYEEALESLALAALDLYRALAEINPDSAQTYANMGATLYYLDPVEEAIRSFEHALSLHPALETARDGLEHLRKVSPQDER